MATIIVLDKIKADNARVIRGHRNSGMFTSDEIKKMCAEQLLMDEADLLLLEAAGAFTDTPIHDQWSKDAAIDAMCVGFNPLIKNIDLPFEEDKK